MSLEGHQISAGHLQLQLGSRAVSTNDLTKSFGWDSTCNFMQEDVHEFNKVLMEALETKMKVSKCAYALHLCHVYLVFVRGWQSLWQRAAMLARIYSE
jgi:hypothetical protein